VLEPLSGYLALAAHVMQHGAGLGACNFGPGADGDRPVEDLVRGLAGHDARRRWSVSGDRGPHEAHTLALSIDRARRVLGWTPRLTFDDALRWTNDGYTCPAGALAELVRRQIGDYEALA
jgi:CDP-glucose 4,6-dehydratase